jgi:hypothetical protein
MKIITSVLQGRCKVSREHCKEYLGKLDSVLGYGDGAGEVMLERVWDFFS